MYLLSTDKVVWSSMWSNEQTRLLGSRWLSHRTHMLCSVHLLPTGNLKVFLCRLIRCWSKLGKQCVANRCNINVIAFIWTHNMLRASSLVITVGARSQVGLCLTFPIGCPCHPHVSSLKCNLSCATRSPNTVYTNTQWLKREYPVSVASSISAEMKEFHDYNVSVY